MSLLIQDLKNEHAIIVSAFNEIAKLGINTKDGQLKLLNVKFFLISHLQKEDEFFYPSLLKVAKTNKNLQTTIEQFAVEMQKISKIALDFFEKYSDGGSGLEFAREFGKLYGTLGKRIHKEESELYEFYEELSLKQ